MLSNFDIVKICKILKIPLAGVVMRNQEYPKNILNKLLVINLDDKTGFGTHWVGLIELQARFIYFDSFGLDCPTEVSNYCEAHKKPLVYNNEQMQSIYTKTCGWFVLLFGYMVLVRHDDPDKVIDDDFINEASVQKFRGRALY